MANTNSQLLTRRQVADQYQVTPGTIRDWEKSGILRGVHINKRLVRYRQEDVDKLLEKSMSPAPA